mmetsp:Transcript_52643/g.151784  ORF Transcript_52643/g.151784 Transcript_52643/m.151784 type:complete len:237 (+) Transcript_52643:128-838(+)
MLYPLTMFCCCSVPIGAGSIMLLHLAANLGYVVCACMNLIAHYPVLFSSWEAHVQLLFTTFCLAGTPIIALGLWGLVHRVEINIRLYLFYLVLCVVIDSGVLIRFFLLGDVCANASGFIELMTPSLGKAFMCGMMQILSYFIVAALIAVQAYCVWAVWSLREDVMQGMNGPELADLIPTKDAIVRKLRHHQDGPLAGIIGFTRTSLPGPYGSIGMEGGSTLFGGGAHETSYPPRTA